MNWLLEIFSDNSDKARLIAILVTSLVAFLLLFLNQYFINKRERIKLFVEKTEELYKSILHLEKHSIGYLGDIGPPSSEDRQELEDHRRKAIEEASYNIRMLGGLYFSNNPQFKDRDVFTEMHKIKLKMIKVNNQDYAGPDMYDPIYQEMNILIAGLKDECRNIKKHNNSNQQVPYRQGHANACPCLRRYILKSHIE